MVKKLGLKIKHRRLSEDFSVYGMTCFNSGKVDIWLQDEGEYRSLSVKRGTVLIDPDTIKKRNVGCYNNTLAHETVHWWKHRDYHILQSVMEKRCAVVSPQMREQCKTDEDWMEWQATNIAPRILMPVETFTMKWGEVMSRMGSQPPKWAVVKELASFFVVSKESTEIRLSALGLM